LPNVGPYIYDVSISGFTRSSIYIYDISSLRVNFNLRLFHPPVNVRVHHCLQLFTTGRYAEETKK